MWSKVVKYISTGYFVTYAVAMGLVFLGGTTYFWMEHFISANSLPSSEYSVFPKAFIVFYGMLSAALLFMLRMLVKTQAKLNKQNARLMESEDRLIEAQTISKMGSWYFQPHTMNTHWTKEMFEIFDFDIKAGEPTADEVRNRIHPEDLEAIEAHFMRVIREGRPYLAQFRVVHDNKKVVWVEMRGEPVWDRENRVCAAQGTCQNITEKVEMEAEIRRQQNASYHQSKLAAIGQLAAGVGHEINNPLAIIDGNAMRIETKAESGKLTDKELLEMVAKIRVSINRIKNITTGLTTFSRSDKKTTELTSIREVILQSMDMLKEIYKNDQIEIVYEDDGKSAEDYKMQSNYGRLQQLFMNLIGNSKDALKGHKEGRVKLSLYSNPEEMEIHVEDNGPGIPKGIQAEIFNPFFTTKKVNEGTGLGLSIVSAIVKEHSGEIELDTDTKKGAKFKIRLPKAS